MERTGARVGRDDWIDRWKDERTRPPAATWRDQSTHGWDDWTDGWMDGWMDKHARRHATWRGQSTDGWDDWIDGWMDGWIWWRKEHARRHVAGTSRRMDGMDRTFVCERMHGKVWMCVQVARKHAVMHFNLCMCCMCWEQPRARRHTACGETGRRRDSVGAECEQAAARETAPRRRPNQHQRCLDGQRVRE